MEEYKKSEEYYKFGTIQKQDENQVCLKNTNRIKYKQYIYSIIATIRI